jgi:hypothetical protein
MMEPNPVRPARKVGIADHLWDTFETMAEAMGADRDALINQAMFMFARLNGFLEVGAGAKPSASAAAPRPASRSSARLSSIQGSKSEDSSGGMQARGEEHSAGLDDDPERREVAERVLETAAELERLIKGKENRQDDGDLDDVSDSAEADDGEGESAEEEGGLYLVMEGADPERMTKERFVIGRGKHCDFVINSGKVSREHAVVIREGDEYFIEDLGSSNGTWYNKQRIKRRKIEDGDEYYICSEKIRLMVR